MSEIPDDAPRSDDGRWWWDGEQWQPVDAEAASDERAAAKMSIGAQSIDEVSDPSQYMTEVSTGVEQESGGTVEVLAFNENDDSDGGSWA